MTRVLFKGSFLLIEGEDDIKVYDRFAVQSACRLKVTYGKPNLLKVIEILDNENFKGVIGIVDNDFWEVDKINSPSNNIVSTDTHDIETMILMSCGLDSVKRELISADKLLKSKIDLMDRLIYCCIPIGHLRWISSEENDNLGLSFKGLKYRKFIDAKTFNIDIHKMTKTVISHSKKHEINEKSLGNKIIQSLKDNKHDPRYICHGEDMVNILLIGLDKTFGKADSKKLTPELLHSFLRTSYTIESFRSTQLYKSIKDWERLNTGYKIFQTPL